jgi:AraC family transcriptional regulator
MMDVQIKDMPELRVATVRHVGPYNQISEAFARLGEIAGREGLLGQPDAAMIAIFHDDPESTPADQLRSDAGISVANDVALPSSLDEKRLPAGQYATTLYRGPYEGLGDVWARFLGEWFPANGHQVGESPSYELYLNNPQTTPKEKLETAIYVPIG